MAIIKTLWLAVLLIVNCIFATGCLGATGYEFRASVNRVDTIEEVRKTFDVPFGDTYHKIVDSRDNAQLSGSN